MKSCGLGQGPRRDHGDVAEQVNIDKVTRWSSHRVLANRDATRAGPVLDRTKDAADGSGEWDRTRAFGLEP